MIIKPCQTIPDGSIQSVTVKRTKTGKVFAILNIRRNTPTVKLPSTNKETGIDLGMKNFAVLSNGIIIPIPYFILQDAKKIKKLYRAISRKQNGSKNKEKAIKQLNIAFEKDKNRRNDFLNKLSLSIVREYDLIALETLSIKEMLKDNKNKHLHKKNRKICELGWYEFARMLKYKSEWYGKTFVQVDRYFASSQICSHCGHKNTAVKDESIREWICPICNTKHDRDRNAAINILQEGKRILMEQDSVPLPVDGGEVTSANRNV